MVEPDDLEAVREVLAGRTESYGRLVKRYQRMVGSLTYRFGVAPEDAEDLVSEIFIKAYENLGRYRPDNAFSTWLYRIAANHILDHMRRKRRERGREELSESIADRGPAPSERTERRQVAERVARLLPLLDEKYRTVLILLHVEEKSVEEISQTLGIPAGTVKTRLARGRQRLAEIVRRHDPSLLDAGVLP